MSTSKARARDSKDKPPQTAGSAGARLRFYNRELSWLQFNHRVLEEAQNGRHPLLERLRFLSISASNLDEFYMVRVAGLHGQVAAKVATVSQDGLTPAQQLAEINRFVAALTGEQQACWAAIKAELAAAGIEIVEPGDLTASERAWLESHFFSHIFPVLTPIAVDPAHPFPFIPNKGFTVGLELERDGAHGDDARADADSRRSSTASSGCPPTAGAPGPPRALIRFMRIETLIALFVGRLFPGYHVARQGAFRVLRDSDIEVEEEAEDLVRFFESALKRRRRG